MNIEMAKQSVADGIEAARKMCGGHGFSQFSGLPEMSANYLALATLEGTRQVLEPQTARYTCRGTLLCCAVLYSTLLCSNDLYCALLYCTLYCCRLVSLTGYITSYIAPGDDSLQTRFSRKTTRGLLAPKAVSLERPCRNLSLDSRHAFSTVLYMVLGLAFASRGNGVLNIFMCSQYVTVSTVHTVQ